MNSALLTPTTAELLHILNPDRDKDTRSPGLHLSAIVRDLLVRMEPKKYSDNTVSDPVLFRWESGFVWEELWSRALLRAQGFFIQPEIILDGIYMTPDAVDPKTEELWEFKFTWKKYALDPALEGEKFWSWFVQMKAYLWGLGLRRARLVVLFANGDYKGTGPLPLVRRYEFTKQELKENWRMLTAHAKTMESAL